MMNEGLSESGMTQPYQTVPQSVDAFGLQGPLRSLYHTSISYPEHAFSLKVNN